MNQIVCVGPFDPIERADIIRVLGEGDLITLPVSDAAELRAAADRGTIPTVAILAGAHSVSTEIRDVLSEINPSAAALVLFDADALIGGGGLTPRSTDEILIRPCPADAIRWRIEAMLVRAGVERDVRGAIRVADKRPDVPTEATVAPGGRECPVTVVFSPKGGVGKTTIATNLAMALRLRNDRRVLLIDADTTTGHVALSLSLPQPLTFVEAIAADARGQHDYYGSRRPTEPATPPALEEIAIRHSSGLMVAALASDPLQADEVDPATVVRAINAARGSFDEIVIDTHPEYGPLNRAILASADRILVPVTPDIPTLRAAVQLRSVAAELHAADRLSLVINRANSGVSRRDIESAVGLDAIGTIRSAGQSVLRAANEGQTLVGNYPKEKISEDFVDLAKQVGGTREASAPTPAQTPAFRGIFGTLRDPARS